jgi:hypothetical protein
MLMNKIFLKQNYSLRKTWLGNEKTENLFKRGLPAFSFHADIIPCLAQPDFLWATHFSRPNQPLSFFLFFSSFAFSEQGMKSRPTLLLLAEPSTSHHCCLCTELLPSPDQDSRFPHTTTSLYHLSGVVNLTDFLA